jgi:hypothetical protein
MKISKYGGVYSSVLLTSLSLYKNREYFTNVQNKFENETDSGKRLYFNYLLLDPR